jgi:hypothetical protein
MIDQIFKKNNNVGTMVPGKGAACELHGQTWSKCMGVLFKNSSDRVNTRIYVNLLDKYCTFFSSNTNQ